MKLKTPGEKARSRKWQIRRCWVCGDKLKVRAYNCDCVNKRVAIRFGSSPPFNNEQTLKMKRNSL